MNVEEQNVQPVQPEVKPEVPQQPQPVQNKAGGKKALAVILILLVVVALVAVYLVKMFSSPKLILATTLEKFSSNITETITKANKTGFGKFVKDNDVIRYDGSIDLTLNEELGLGIEKLTLGLDMTTDMKNKKASVDLTASLDKEELITGTVKLHDNKMYLKEKRLSRYYYMPMEYEELFEETEVEDYKVFIDLFIESVNESVEEKDFAKEKTDVEIDGKTVKVTKYTLEVNKELTKKVMSHYIDLLKQNSKAKALVEKFATLEDGEEFNYEKELDELKESLDDMDEFKNELVLYIKGMNDLVKFSYVVDGEELAYTNLNGNSRIALETDEINIDFNWKDNDGKVNFIIDMDGTSFKGHLYSKDGKEEIEVVFNDGSEYKFLLTSTTKEVDKNSKYEVDMTMSVTIDGEELGSAKAKFEISKGNEIDIQDLTGALDAENLTTKQEEDLYEEIMEIPVFSIMMTLMGGSLAL